MCEATVIARRTGVSNVVVTYSRVTLPHSYVLLLGVVTIAVSTFVMNNATSSTVNDHHVLRSNTGPPACASSGAVYVAHGTAS